MTDCFEGCKFSIDTHVDKAEKKEVSQFEKDDLDLQLKLLKVCYDLLLNRLEIAGDEISLYTDAIQGISSDKRSWILKEIETVINEYTNKRTDLTKLMDKHLTDPFSKGAAHEEGESENIQKGEKNKVINRPNLSDRCSSIMFDCNPSGLDEFFTTWNIGQNHA